MNVREIRQKEGADAWLASDRKSIVKAAPRMGKTFLGVDIFKRGKYKKIEIAIPRLDIGLGWQDTFKLLGYDDKDITYITFTSLKHLKLQEGELLVLDEIHELSKNQMKCINNKGYHKSNDILGLTGTLTRKSQEELYDELLLDVCYDYPIYKAVEEGILTDYEIIVHRIELDNSKLLYGKGTKTEKKQYNNLIYAAEEAQGINKFYIEQKIMSIIQSSYSKLQFTRKLLERFKNDRVLVFCGLTEIANQLEIPVYHSKSKDRQVFEDFCKGLNYKHLATIRMMQSGITIVPINKGIINYTSGNPEDAAQKICRFLAIEYNNPDKKAELHFLVTNEEFAISRANTALNFFDKTKIKWI